MNITITRELYEDPASRAAFESSNIRMPNLIRCGVTVETKAINEETREALHVISSINADRAGDVVVPEGAVLDAFKKNPVVLADHHYSIEKIIGTAVDIQIDKKQIRARTKFDTEGIGDRAWGLVKRGMAKSWSIGFKPLEFEHKYEEFDDGSRRYNGTEYKSWELLEYSLVAIPMNPDAVTECVQNGALSLKDFRHLYINEPSAETRDDQPGTPAPHQAKAVPRVSQRNAQDLLDANYAVRLLERAADAASLSDDGVI